MSSLLDGKNEKKGISKIFLIGAVIAVLSVGAIITTVVLLPTPEQEKEAVLVDAYRIGSPNFEEYSKNIVISTDPKRLFVSYTGMGGIVMQIGGKVRNRGEKTVIGLEVSVGMINTKNEIIKDKKVLIIPKDHAQLKPGESVNVSYNIPGFEEDDDRANARWQVTAIKFKEE